ncbi:ribbon-helix-helix domain-containing protein [Nocardia sp. BMG51109]|uniref:ribbon-helix-helix domain-containing protein n=1 Tax=Nocardia sp. BMG51109 TaxID=1056816 RepID=UPI0018DD8D26|nr:ribbon-helix-helix domain-containing protein [Nocardia sp. BMG51109]
MKSKTSVYLEAEQAARLESVTEATGRSKSDLIREGIDLMLLRSSCRRRTRPWPSFDSGDPEFAATAGWSPDEAQGQ